jgi:DNA-binding response OmpR family regulator
METPPNINVPASIHDLTHDVRIVRTSLEKQTERLDRIESDLVFIIKHAAGKLPPPNPADGRPAGHDLKIHKCDDGAIEFTVDDGKQVTLPPRLAEVFLFLVIAAGETNDEATLAGWRTKPEIIGHLEASGSPKITRTYVNYIIHRIRKALVAAGYTRRLIQTHRRKGVRLAIENVVPGAWVAAATA